MKNCIHCRWPTQGNFTHRDANDQEGPLCDQCGRLFAMLQLRAIEKPEPTTPEPQYPELLKRALNVFEAMEWHKRPDAISAISDVYCLHCGIEQPKGRSCQCWNDE